MKSGKVLVTGASGFIASHIVKQLLEQGYDVRGTVRSTKNLDKYKWLTSMADELDGDLELVEGNLLDADCWNDAAKG